MQHLKHIIWDWNGTLLDDTLACVNSVNKMLADRGLTQLTVEHYRDIFGFPVSDFYNKIGFVLENEDWDQMAAEFHDMFLADRSVTLHGDARTVLTQLQEYGLIQSILSASEQSILDTMLCEYKLDSFFQRIMGIHNMYGDSKISMGRKLIEKMDVPLSEILMIGDSLHDFEVAGDLEIGCVLIAQGHQSFDRLATAGVPVLYSLKEVPDLIAVKGASRASCR
jgi:phosphoglycolate phosphatase